MVDIIGMSDVLEMLVVTLNREPRFKLIHDALDSGTVLFDA